MLFRSGSGGAAYATVVCMLKEAKSIHIFNRTVENALLLKEQLSPFSTIPIVVHGMEECATVPIEVVIQTTGVGMGKLKGEMPSCTKNILKDAQYAIDLIYNPKETLFLEYANAKGIKTVNGFGMLFYQAVLAYEKMHQITCNLETLKEIKKELEDELM